MVELSHYMDDGASWQAKAVLAYIQFDKEILLDEYYGTKFHDAVEIRVARFENCREQGYYLIITLPGRDLESFGYAFAEHRSSDNIVVYKASKCTSVYGDTPRSMDFLENVDENNYKHFSCGQIVECGDWIESDIQNHFNEFLEKHSEYYEKV